MYMITPIPFTFGSVSEPEDDAATWAVGTTYDIGASVMVDGVIYVSTIDGNVGLDPTQELQELEGARWLRKGATNVRKFYDNSLSTSTVGTSPLVIEITADANYNAISLLNLRGSKTTVETITGATTKLVGTINSGAEPVDNWWDWLQTVFYKNTSRVILPDASGFSGSTIRVTIEGDTTSIGEIVVGHKLQIGKTKMEAATNMRRKTFTSIETNDFGETTVTKRAIARDVTYSVIALREGFGAKANALDAADGVRVVTYAEPSDWEQFVNYGFITDWELPADMPEHFIFEITTQGVS